MATLTICACGHLKSMHTDIEAIPEHPCFFKNCECVDFKEVSDEENVLEFSPTAVPDAPVLLGFGEAVGQVLRGKRATRQEWGDSNIWIMMRRWPMTNPKVPEGTYLSVHFGDNIESPLYCNDGDLSGIDWYVLD